MKPKAIIIDDERINIQFLTSLISSYCPEIELVATATNVDSGLALINEHQPHIIFLDIEIHDKTGFDILNLVEYNSLQVILITAYEKYAIQAFKYGVVDYILKPVKIDELKSAVERSIARIAELVNNTFEPTLKKNEADFLKVYNKDSVEILPYAEILYLEADGGCTRIITTKKSKILSTRSLKENEDSLSEETFLRVHHSYVINISHVKKYVKGKNGSFIMSDDSQVPISATRKKEVIIRLGL